VRSIPMPGGPAAGTGAGAPASDAMSRTTIHPPPAAQATVPFQTTPPSPTGRPLAMQPQNSRGGPATGRAPVAPGAPGAMAGAGAHAGNAGAAARRPATAARPAQRADAAPRGAPRPMARPEPVKAAPRNHVLLTILLVGAALVVGAIAARVILSGR
jgi:hypothetical protein